MRETNMEKISVVFLPFSGSHLTSMVEAAKVILRHCCHESSICATVLLMKDPDPSLAAVAASFAKSTSASLPSNIDLVFEQLPAATDFHPEECADLEDSISVFIDRNKKHVKDALLRILESRRVAALFIDFFATSVIDVADKLGISTYIYFCSTAAFLSLMLHLPYTEEEIAVPGLPNVPKIWLPDPVVSKQSKSYEWFVYHGRRFLETKGLIVNTFAELEPGPLNALANGGYTTPVYPIGPVVSLDARPFDKNGKQQEDCIRWLDEQPDDSVLYLCFGSLGSLKGPQVKEIAAALERSGHRFLWCLRSPSASGSMVPTDAKLDEVLPEGFQERTKERGLVWPRWAPQIQILGHPAVGGFVTHCGWNSILESLWFGVPMLPWPMFAEQHLNDLEMVREMGVAVKLQVDREHGNFVTADELERGIKCLMSGESEEGNRARARAKFMQEESRKALGTGGSSFKNLSQLIEELKANTVSE